MNGSGTIVVEYTYDAWGYIRNTTGSLKDTLGKANALRYRGYVYDTETCLYYLQSRYYNPGTGRFINADALVSTGQGLLGNNMFAYCLNNPVAYSDKTGNVAMVCFDNNIRDLAVTWKAHGGGSTNYNGGMSTLPVVLGSSKKKLTFFGMLTNADAQIASDAKYFAFYKGVPIVKIKGLGNAAFSFGVVFMGSKSSANLVKHEYGHTVHLTQIGPINYFAKVVVPSVASFWLFRDNMYYESQPWEYIAEVLGDTTPPQDGYLDWADELGAIYWFFTKLR